MDWKKLGKKLLFPPIWLMLLLTVASAALLGYVFAKGQQESIAAYFVYVLAFYTLSVVTLFCILVLPKQYSQIKQKVYANPLASRFLTDRAFRTKVMLYLSLGINLLYVGLNMLTWHFVRSWWFVVLAIYYAIMAIMRFLLVRYVRKNTLGRSTIREWKRSRICAYILLLINLSLSGAVLMILYHHRGYDYPGVLIYVMALYSFYAVTHTIVDMVRYRRLGSPILSTAKVVSLSAALVSMLNLETAMFAQFGGEMAQKDQNLMIILTGAGISAIVVSLSVMLIVKATKAIRRENYGK